jgi:hypothetical protein
VARWDGEEKEGKGRRGIIYGPVAMGQGDSAGRDDCPSWDGSFEVDKQIG